MFPRLFIITVNTVFCTYKSILHPIPRALMMAGVGRKGTQGDFPPSPPLASHQHPLFPSHRTSATIWTPFSRSFSCGKRCKLPPPPPRLLLAKSPKEKADGTDAVGNEKQINVSGWNGWQEGDGFSSWHWWVLICRSTHPDGGFQRIPWQWYCWIRSTSLKARWFVPLSTESLPRQRFSLSEPTGSSTMWKGWNTLKLHRCDCTQLKTVRTFLQ